VISGNHDLAYLEDVDPEQFVVVALRVATEAEQQQFELVGSRQIAAFIDFLLYRFHG